MPIVKEEFNAARRSEMLLIIGDLRYLSPIIKNRELFMTLLDYGFFLDISIFHIQGGGRMFCTNDFQQFHCISLLRLLEMGLYYNWLHFELFCYSPRAHIVWKNDIILLLMLRV